MYNISKATHLTPEILSIIRFNNYETKDFLIRNNLIGLPLGIIFNPKACTFEPISLIARSFNANRSMFLYKSEHQKILIPTTKINVNEKGLITDLFSMSHGTKYQELKYNSNNNIVYKNNILYPNLTAYYGYCNDGSITKTVYDNSEPIRNKPFEIISTYPSGFKRSALTFRSSGTKFDEFTNVIRTRSFLYENQYESSKLISTIVRSISNNDPEYTITYRYDDYGNCVERSVFDTKQNAIDNIEKRKITYKNNRLSKIVDLNKDNVLYEIND